MKAILYVKDTVSCDQIVEDLVEKKYIWDIVFEGEHCGACQPKNSDPIKYLTALPDCIFCETNNWKFLQFGIDTNYFICQTCSCVTPPKKTKQEAIDEIMKIGTHERHKRFICKSP